MSFRDTSNCQATASYPWSSIGNVKQMHFAKIEVVMKVLPGAGDWGIHSQVYVLNIRQDNDMMMWQHSTSKSKIKERTALRNSENKISVPLSADLTINSSIILHPSSVIRQPSSIGNESTEQQSNNQQSPLKHWKFEHHGHHQPRSAHHTLIHWSTIYQNLHYRIVYLSSGTRTQVGSRVTYPPWCLAGIR